MRSSVGLGLGLRLRLFYPQQYLLLQHQRENYHRLNYLTAIMKKERKQNNINNKRNRIRIGEGTEGRKGYRYMSRTCSGFTVQTDPLPQKGKEKDKHTNETDDFLKSYSNSLQWLAHEDISLYKNRSIEVGQGGTLCVNFEEKSSFKPKAKLDTDINIDTDTEVQERANIDQLLFKGQGKNEDEEKELILDLEHSDLDCQPDHKTLLSLSKINVVSKWIDHMEIELLFPGNIHRSNNKGKQTNIVHDRHERDRILHFLEKYYTLLQKTPIVASSLLGEVRDEKGKGKVFMMGIKDWENYCLKLFSIPISISAERIEKAEKVRGVEENEKEAHLIRHEARMITSDLMLNCHIPEKFDLNLKTNGDITLSNKIEGDIFCSSKLGDIIVDKIRGMSLELLAPSGEIMVKKYIEGSIRLEAPTIYAKKMLGDDILLISHGNGNGDNKSNNVTSPGKTGQGIYLDSLYSKICQIQANPSLTKRIVVNRNHGHVHAVVKSEIKLERRDAKIEAKEEEKEEAIEEGQEEESGDFGGIALNGVNGSCNVSLAGLTTGDITVKFEGVSIDSDSFIYGSQNGTVEIQVSPELNVDMDLQGPVLDSFPPNFQINLEREELMNGRKINRTCGKLSNRLKKKTSKKKTKKVTENQLKSNSGVGKINIQGAELQALHLFERDRNHSEIDAYNKDDHKTENEKGKSESTEKVIRIVAPGGIKIKTRSWMDDVKGKFGLDHVQYKTTTPTGSL